MIFSLVFALPLQSAAQTDIIQVNTGNTGWDIVYPKYEYVKLNANFELDIAIHNQSTGDILTDKTCYLFLQNSTGDITCSSPLTYNAGLMTHSITIYQGNFSDLGIHAFYIMCSEDDVEEGGFASGTFEVTLNGNENNLWMYIFLVVFAAFLIAITVLINVKFNQKRREELYKRIVTGYFNIRNNEKGDLGSVILYVMAYGLLNLLVGFYYLEILFLMFVLTETIIVFNIVSLITIFTTLLNVLAWGFILVFIVIIFKMFELFKNLIKDINDSFVGIMK